MFGESTDQAYANLRENFFKKPSLGRRIMKKIIKHPYFHKKRSLWDRITSGGSLMGGAANAMDDIHYAGKQALKLGAGVAAAGYGAHKVRQLYKANKNKLKGAVVGGYRGAKKTQSLHGTVSKAMGQGRLWQLKSRAGGVIKGAREGSKIGYSKGHSYLNKHRGRIFSDSANINVYSINKKPVAMRVHTYNKKLGRKHKYIR